MIEELNSLLEKNEIMVRVGCTWYSLDSIGPMGNDEFPIVVSDEDGQDWEYDMADIEEFDPLVKMFSEMDINIVGIA